MCPWYLAQIVNVMNDRCGEQRMEKNHKEKLSPSLAEMSVNIPHGLLGFRVHVCLGMSVIWSEFQLHPVPLVSGSL
jgi:hypothetical protein